MLRRKDKQAPPRPSELRGHFLGNYLLSCERYVFASRGYMINVASARNGVGYGDWTRIDGFSENVLRFIREIEAL